MRYLPHTDADIGEMLSTIGVDTIDDLFQTIPPECRFSADLSLPGPVTEWELKDLMTELSQSDAASPGTSVYIGAGSYDHFIPASASYLLSRSEFVTSYTPYQPELSQGTLQAIYEYQTLIARLLGMDVSNASLYDGASALAEALLMAVRITKKKTLLLSSTIHPLYRRVVETYLAPTDCTIEMLSLTHTGETDITSLSEKADCAAVAVQSPNFFGCIEDMASLADAAHGNGALLVASFSEPLCFGLYKNPGSMGADIVCGEAQSLGIPRSFGGPGLGILTCRAKDVRHMPGRLVGKTVDREGRRGFVLTLATREQHIRREKATSNICTNNSLCALASSIYLASLGGTGLTELARLNYDKTEYLKMKLKKAGCAIPFSAPTFNEFVVIMPDGFREKYSDLAARGVVAGIPLERLHPALDNHYLVCVTETKTKEDLDKLVTEVTT